MKLKLGRYEVKFHKADLWILATLLLLIGVIALFFVGRNVLQNQDAEIQSQADGIASLQQDREDLQLEVSSLQNENEDLTQQIHDAQDKIDELELDASSSSSFSVPSIRETCGPHPSIDKYNEQKDVYNACVDGWYQKYLPGFNRP